MTVAIGFLTLTNSIAALSISGVTVKDADEINVNNLRNPSTLYPRPRDFITDIAVSPDELSKQKLTMRYTMHYEYYYLPIGSTLSFEKYNTLLTNIAAILSSILNNHIISGAMDTELPAVENIGVIVDPAGNSFFGCAISLRVMQFLG